MADVDRVILLARLKQPCIVLISMVGGTCLGIVLLFGVAWSYGVQDRALFSWHVIALPLVMSFAVWLVYLCAALLGWVGGAAAGLVVGLVIAIVAARIEMGVGYVLLPPFVGACFGVTYAVLLRWLKPRGHGHTISLRRPGTR